MTRAPTLMVQGTGSGVGKSWLGSIGSNEDSGSWDTRLEATFDVLADSVEAALGIEPLLKLIERGAP